MGENQIDKFFENAVVGHELDKFLVGEGKYFFPDKEYGIHWQLGMYIRYVEPFIDRTLPVSFWKEIFHLLNNYNDKNILIDCLVLFLIPYYNSQDESLLNERTRKTPDELIRMIKSFLNSNMTSLIADKRGTGVEWNSKMGLWGSIRANLRIIAERGGPDFLT